jgi:hypothetical protein
LPPPLLTFSLSRGIFRVLPHRTILCAPRWWLVTNVARRPS